ncbi:methylmalonate-semialdehyde dehydrogenase [Xylona heveae TC161]|uniref:methylmalonate-semialdehyde dehydrogenase (CoA acylating) n=1 Tax=Xylona heveae (strain CBS 132557 / TC161) TaxID=1328760 RepID=A0A161TDC3_XYLHT|nr:methylmalonate-semialdehyde dehydrogenase [Xylona heveae TC161]KZF23827.1 methylmalonate-semialdehyde dehydrogenase [Xylona heveae TC161]
MESPNGAASAASPPKGSPPPTPKEAPKRPEPEPESNSSQPRKRQKRRQSSAKVESPKPVVDEPSPKPPSQSPVPSKTTPVPSSTPKPPPGPTGVIRNFIGNQFIASKTRSWSPAFDPSTQKLLTRVPESTQNEVHEAVASAERAQLSWRRLPLTKRREHLYRLTEIFRVNRAKLAQTISLDTGKTLEDASSEVSRSINMCEAAHSVTSVILGYHFYNESTATDTINEPLGVCMAVTPFTFPLMIPMWFIPFALATGNTMVLKPSEQTPMATTLLAEMIIEAGFPPGVLNIVHGGPTVVDQLLAEPAIKAVSFVGSDQAGRHVYDIAVASRKRIQANCAAKNHGVILPDASKWQTLYGLAGSAFGAAGQRCMGISVAVFVGSSIDWLPELVQIAQRLKVGPGYEPGIDIGPLISPAAKAKVEQAIQTAIDDGATLLLDGRGLELEAFPDGNFLGPTILSNVQTYMPCYQEEIFGPVLVCLHVDTLEEAIEMVNDNRYGNGASIFTSSATKAQQFQRDVNVGRIGINVPLLATSGQVSNSSNKDSFLGEINFHGFKGYDFYTSIKTVSSIWREDPPSL